MPPALIVGCRANWKPLGFAIVDDLGGRVDRLKVAGLSPPAPDSDRPVPVSRHTQKRPLVRTSPITRPMHSTVSFGSAIVASQSRASHPHARCGPWQSTVRAALDGIGG
jgi:hypothetical protein